MQRIIFFLRFSLLLSALGLTFVSLFLIICFGVQADAQGISTDAVSSADGTNHNANSLTWSHTVGSGSNRILLVGITTRDGNVVVNSVTYGGTNLTLIGVEADNGKKVRMEMWKLIAPNVGTADIVVSLSASKRVVGGAVSLTGVNQTTPNGLFSSASSSGSTSASLTVSSASGELVVDVIATQGDAKSLTINSGTEIWNRATGNAGGESRSAGGTINGASSVTPSWTLESSKPWAIGAVSLKPSPPNITLLKSVSVSGNPQPDTDLAYTVNFTNDGASSASNLIITDAIPANTDFKVNSETHNLGTTSLTVAVAYSNNNGSTYTYTPVSGGGSAPSGYDRAVTNIRWTFSGNLTQTSPNNTGSVSFTVRIR